MCFDTKRFDHRMDQFVVFKNGHVTDEAMLVRAAAGYRLSPDDENRISSHVKDCQPCRERWNEYYIEWCS
jgi:hypothetical protein